MDYKNIFLSRKNLLQINNNLFNELNIKNITHDDKKKYITILFNNMSESYNKLKLNSINKTNLDFVKNQYNNIVLKTTISDINNLQNNNSLDNNNENNMNQMSQQPSINNMNQIFFTTACLLETL